MSGPKSARFVSSSRAVSYTHLDVYKRQLFDLIKFAYGDHLHGDETCPAWVETATAQIKLTGDDAEGYLKAIDNHVYYPFYCITFYFRFSV